MNHTELYFITLCTVCSFPSFTWILSGIILTQLTIDNWLKLSVHELLITNRSRRLTGRFSICSIFWMFLNGITFHTVHSLPPGCSELFRLLWSFNFVALFKICEFFSAFYGFSQKSTQIAEIPGTIFFF